MSKEKPTNKKRNIRPGRRQGWLDRLALTPKEIEEVNRRDEKRKKELERQRAWQIKTFGYYDPGAADY